MQSTIRYSTSTIFGLIAVCLTLVAAPVVAQEEPQSASEKDARAALANLVETTPSAKDLMTGCKGVLVFPSIVKAGFLVGAKYGTGMLLEGNSKKGFDGTEHFNIAAASYGLQAGVQSFGYAMVLMTDEALRFVKTRSGFELGVGPNITVVDEGVAKTLTTATAKDDIYAFTFGQQGLMGGLGLEGTKITKLDK